MRMQSQWWISVGLLVLGFAARPAAAQPFGFIVGPTFSDVITSYGNNTGSSYQTRRSVTLGATYRRRLARGTVFQPELLLVQRGWSRSQPTLSLVYLELPLLLRLGALSPEGWPVRPVFTLGPTVSLLAHCKLSELGVAQAVGRGCSRRIVQPFDVDYRIQRIDAGAMLGLGVEMRTGGGTIVGVEGRVELGLIDVRPRDGGRSRNATFFIVLNVVPRRATTRTSLPWKRTGVNTLIRG